MFHRSWFILFVVLWLVGCTTASYSETPLDAERKEAYDAAVSCVLQGESEPQIGFQEIKWVVVPGDHVLRMFDFRKRTYTVVLALYEPIFRRIFIADKFKDIEWVLEHEITHALGFYGHPDEPFRRCDLLPEQHNVDL